MSDNAGAPTPPRGNKFAAMAARQAEAKAATTSNESDSAAKETATEVPTQTIKPAPKRDKFAVMAARATTATTTTDNTTTSSSGNTTIKTENVGKPAVKEEAMPTKEDEQNDTTTVPSIDDLLKRANQRDQVWKDLEMAEVTVIRLLRVAQQSAEALQGSNNNSSLHLSLEYRQHLTRLHELLAPHASLVQAYQPPNKPNQLYQARIEERLALEKQKLLRDWIDMESSNTTDVVVSGDKRKREE